MATVLGVFFWIWGILGLLLNSINYLSLSGSVGVGTSAYVALGLLYWIAGMILFGVGALMARAAPARLSEPFVYAAPPPVATEAPLPLQSIVTPPPPAAATDKRTQPRFDLPLKLAATVVGIGAVIFVVASIRTNAPGEKVVREQVTTPANDAKTSAVAGTIEDADAAYNRGDYSTAIKIYRPLAAYGNPKAQLNIGLMYVEGQGVAKDLVIAQQWFKSAAANPASDQATRAEAISNQDVVARRLAR